MRVTLITTIEHNVGDDFVREGILHLLDSIGVLDSVELIHKHSPITAVYGFEKYRTYRVSRVLDPTIRVLRLRDRVSESDVLVQSGTPVYWCHPDGPHCADNEWFDPLIRKRFLSDRRGRAFLNIAGGSCQRYHSDGSEISSCQRCGDYIREFFDSCALTILRDRLARTMLNRVGRDAQILPCTSIFARDRFGLMPQAGEFVVINCMENGGHYTFGQAIDGDRWRLQFQQIAHLVRKMGRVVVACHSKEEERLAQSLVPDLERFLVPNDHLEFMKFYARARFGVVNRVHAGFMMASFGKPVAVIGNDSRARMIENLSLQSHFVGDIESSSIEGLVESVSAREGSYSDEIEAIRSESRKEYIRVLGAALLK
ncbi:MAG: polysaccharide pyruvyl transferase family protein [Nitrospirota bacterium]